EEEKKDESDDASAIHAVRSVGPASYEIPIAFDEPNHKPHLANFFAAIRGEATLACPGETGYEALATVAKIREALETARRIEIPDEVFSA
ncbi:MAG: hypothetical protein JXP34_26955, partial [Planctomycetes bacterium]|nr:hypothetical protein [Planctomycetota bacterium]